MKKYLHLIMMFAFLLISTSLLSFSSFHAKEVYGEESAVMTEAPEGTLDNSSTEDSGFGFLFAGILFIVIAVVVVIAASVSASTAAVITMEEDAME